MQITFEDRCKRLVKSLDLGDSEQMSVTPLAGGVSSDIALVEINKRKFCVKFALAELKVEEEWLAPLGRNRAEYGWLQYVSDIIPSATPKLYGRNNEFGGFAMEFIEGDDVYLWKDVLLQGKADNGEAEEVGLVLGKIHAAASMSEIIKTDFQNHEDFHALRIEPYLLFTAHKHPALQNRIETLVKSIESHRYVLVHGDVSPKNIMFRNSKAVFLDAECATAGEPAFDIAFCLNHLVLKALHVPSIKEDALNSVLSFWKAYSEHIVWEDCAELERRVCELLPMLMLARVDGKSPVEYLTESEQKFVRDMACVLIMSNKRSLTDIVDVIKNTEE